ncbi:MAG: hypothetical protein ACYDBQ_02460 [Thermoplasmatota archaeon]
MDDGLPPIHGDTVIIDDETLALRSIATVSTHTERQGILSRRFFYVVLRMNSGRPVRVKFPQQQDRDQWYERLQKALRKPSLQNVVTASITELEALRTTGAVTEAEWIQAKAGLLDLPVPRQKDAIESLVQLHQLARKGVISESEYNMKKWDILSRKI